MTSAGHGSGGAARVLMIGGWGRCGSTLLDMMLGQVPGVVSTGEIREIWLRGCVENRPCSCERPFGDCDFWRAVGEHAYGGWDRLDLTDLLRTRYRVDRPWGVPLLAARPPQGGADSALDRYAEALSRLYQAILAVSGARVVVDSSKIATHAMLVRSIPDVDARVVHLVRDSRGVAYSIQKTVVKAGGDGESTLLPRHGAFASSARYVLYNGLAATLQRLGLPYLRLRYEDLVADPAGSLQKVLAHVDETADGFPFLAGGTAQLEPTHLVEGNPVRFSQGPLVLRRDDEWRRKLSSSDRRLVTALTLPLLRRYRYPVRG